MKRRTFFNAAALLTVLAGSAVVAVAHDNLAASALPTPVLNVMATITQLNYDESVGLVNGFLVGNNVLLTFAKPVCGGIGTLGAVGNSVTYSGSARTLASGFEIVNVTSFTNNTTTVTYPPAPIFTKPVAYPLTAGTITQLNYDPENGVIEGFLFTPTPGPSATPSAVPSARPEVLVDIVFPNATLMPLLTVNASLSVAGTMQAPGGCAPAGAIPEVYASSLVIGSKTYHLGGTH